MQQEFSRYREELTLLKDVESLTLDGIRIGMFANIELPEEAELALENGADGIGLFRS